MSDADYLCVAAELARRQYGVVARRQLVARGVSHSTIANRVRSGHLSRVFSGTYAVGRAEVSRHGLWVAGVLASGHGAALGYRSAAAAWGILDTRPAVETIRRSEGLSQRAEVLLDGNLQSIPLIVRRTRGLPDQDVALVQGIPVTSVARTLLDLSSSTSAAEFRRLFLAADRLDLLDDAEIRDCAGRDIRRRGVREFRRLVNRRIAEAGQTRSILEAVFLDLCASSGIEAPQVNAQVCGFEVDCVWRRSRLAVELDGYRYHRGRESFERDAHRANVLKAAGWTLMRFTWRMVTEDGDRVATQISSMIRQGGDRGQAVGKAPE